MKKICSFFKKYITADGIRIFILFVPLVIILVRQCMNNEFDWSKYLDTSILVSFLLAFLCDAIATLILHIIGKKYEDSAKLSDDYEEMAKKYSREDLIEYGDKKFPVICLTARKKSSPCFNITIDQENCFKNYKLPKQIDDKSDYIMSAHKYSIIFNKINIRLDDISYDNNNVTLFYSKTTYYDSLTTNRAMDFKLDNGKTVREIYEPGPFLSKLSESKLSNHLGFNGFIETSDGKFIFVIRSKNLSIGKNTLGDSIGASLKSEYCLDEDRKLTLDGLDNAIRKEIYEELKIEVDENIDLTTKIFAFYRDLVEGGKPQFLFYYKMENMTQKQFKDHFSAAIKKEKKKLKKKASTDGFKFVFLSAEELKQCVITPGKLILPNKKRSFKIMPSASASIVMLLDYLD